jgi:hypothetical protein
MEPGLRVIKYVFGGRILKSLNGTKSKTTLVMAYCADGQGV